MKTQKKWQNGNFVTIVQTKIWKNFYISDDEMNFIVEFISRNLVI